jgi:hypothetical protein
MVSSTAPDARDTSSSVDLAAKAVLLGATFLIDFVHFENRK